LELKLGLSHNSTIGIASKLDEAFRAHEHRRGYEIELFLRLFCRENDALGDPTWLDLEERGKGDEKYLLNDHLLEDQCLNPWGEWSLG